MVDKNIRTDYKKLKMLAEIELNYGYSDFMMLPDKVVQRFCANTQLHLLKGVFWGAEMAVCEKL